MRLPLSKPTPPLNPRANPSATIGSQSGSAMPSSASGRIGVRNRRLKPATGMPGICTYRDSEQNKYHVATYGHPRKFGYKDIIPTWKADKFDPAHLVSLYKKAGAKYFISMGVHHDNFDMWNSKHTPWNAVNMGPEARTSWAYGRKAARERRSEVRRQRASLDHLQVVFRQPRHRPDRAAGRRALRWRRSRTTPTSITMPTARDLAKSELRLGRDGIP